MKYELCILPLCGSIEDPEKLLASARVISRHTDPYTPQQNGMAERQSGERANRYLDEGACTFLAAAKLPEAFWAEASRHFYLIANITLWKKNNGFTVDSYQRLHGRPFADHLQPLLLPLQDSDMYCYLLLATRPTSFDITYVDTSYSHI